MNDKEIQEQGQKKSKGELFPSTFGRGFAEGARWAEERTIECIGQCLVGKNIMTKATYEKLINDIINVKEE